MTTQEKQNLYQAMIPTIMYNYNHFYNGDFENILKRELFGMLKSI